MSWFLRLAPVVLVCACGGTGITREGDECMSPVPGNCCEPGYCAYDPNLGHWACSYMGCAG